MSFVKRSIILCPYLGGSTIGGYTVIGINKHRKKMSAQYANGVDYV